jgi:hypothetical protein
MFISINFKTLKSVELYINFPYTPSWHGALVLTNKGKFTFLLHFELFIFSKRHSHLSMYALKVKGKAKVSLCLTKHHVMKAYWGVEV